MLMTLLACAPETSLVVVGHDNAPTVLTASWESEGETRLVYEQGGREWSSTWATGPQREVQMLGLRADEAVDLQVQHRDGAGFVTEGSTATAWTDLLPEDLPIPASSEGEMSGPVLTSIVLPTDGDVADGGAYLAVLDEEGEIVWTTQTPTSMANGAQLDPTGDGVWYVELKGLWHASWTGEHTRVADLDPHHDFAVLPDGRIAISMTRALDTEDLVDEIWLYDPATDSSELLVDLLEFEHLFDNQLEFGFADLTHVNSVTWDEERQLLMIGAAGQKLVLCFDLSGQLVAWVTPEGAKLQHKVIPTEDGFSLFVNQGSEGDTCAAVVEYDLTGVALDSYAGDCLTVFALGGLDATDDGGRLVSWGSAGRLEEIGPDQEQRFVQDLPIGSAYGYVQRVSSLKPR